MTIYCVNRDGEQTMYAVTGRGSKVLCEKCFKRLGERMAAVLGIPEQAAT